MACSRGKGTFGADDRSGLQQALILRWQAVDAGSEYRLHRSWHCRLSRGAPGDRRHFPDQHLRLYQGCGSLLQEEGITASAGAQGAA